MKTYRTQSCGSIVITIIFNMMGLFMLSKAVQEVAHRTDQLFFFSIIILFCVGWLALVNISWLMREFEVTLTYDGVLVIRARLRVKAKIPIHEIAQISFPAGRFYPLSWTNWEETGGDILIRHSVIETKIGRFPHDENFVMELVSRNPAIEVVRTQPIAGD
jgi:hypothetical protein